MNAAERLFALMERRAPGMSMSALGRDCWARIRTVLGECACGRDDTDHLGLCPTHRKEIIGMKTPPKSGTKALASLDALIARARAIVPVPGQLSLPVEADDEAAEQ